MTVLFVGPVALACGWPIATCHSARFTENGSERAFSRLPPIAGPVYERFSTFDYAALVTPTSACELAPDETIRAQMAASDDEGDLLQIRRANEQFLSATTPKAGEITEPADDEGPPFAEWRRSALDRRDILETLGQGAPEGAVRACLRARTAIDAQASPATIRSLLEPALGVRALQDNTEYLAGAAEYAAGDLAAAALRFERAEALGGEKSEAALLMRGVCALKSHGANEDDAGEASDDVSVEWDRELRLARSLFERLLARHPEGTYARDAQGWIARSYLLAGDVPEALARYFDILATSSATELQTARMSVALVRSRLGAESIAELERRLESRPAGALCYAFYETYNWIPTRGYDD